MTHPGWVVAFGLILSSLASPGLFRLQIDTNHLTYLRHDRNTTRSFGFIDAHFGGVLPLEILVRAPEQDANQSIVEMTNLENDLRSLSGMGSVISVADFLSGGGYHRSGSSTGPNFFTDSYPKILLDQLGNQVPFSTRENSYFIRTDSSFFFGSPAEFT